MTTIIKELATITGWKYIQFFPPDKRKRDELWLKNHKPPYYFRKIDPNDYLEKKHICRKIDPIIYLEKKPICLICGYELFNKDQKISHRYSLLDLNR